MNINKNLLIYEDDVANGVSVESTLDFIKEINKNRMLLKITSMQIICFRHPKDGEYLLAELHIETSLERMFTFQYGLLNIYAAPTATMSAVDKLFAPQLEEWSQFKSLRFKNIEQNLKLSKNFNPNKPLVRETKVIWEINPDNTCKSFIDGEVKELSVELKDVLERIKLIRN